MSDPSTISVLLGFPVLAWLCLVIAAFSGWYKPLGRLFDWLIHDAGRWGQ